MNQFKKQIGVGAKMNLQISRLSRNLIGLGGSLLGASILGAAPTDHLDRGLDLVDHILQHQLAGEFQNDQNEDINNYGGSWGDGTVEVELGDHNADVMPFNRTMCGSFVTKLLNQSYNWDWTDYPFTDDVLNVPVVTASPTAHLYMELVLEGKGFKLQVDNIADILPGDVMVKRNLNPIAGHVWLVKEVHIGNPLVYPLNHGNSLDEYKGMTYYEVDVLDSSFGYHSYDTRKVTVNNVVHNTHGAGVGTMGIMVDANGTITGHSWSVPNSDYNQSLGGWVNGVNSRLELLDETEFVVARLDLVDEEDEDEGGVEPLDLDLKAPVIPCYLDLGIKLNEQLEEMHALGIDSDSNGERLNQYGGSWNSSSDPSFIRVADLDRGILPGNNTKGASLVTLLLKEACSWSWWDYTFIDSKTGRVTRSSSPTSSRYVDLIEQGVGFDSEIKDLSRVLLGDVIAIRKWSDWSGHTVIVESIDWENAKAYPAGIGATTSELDGAWIVPVRVLDSTRYAHSSDTRSKATETTDGLGLGTMGVVMNAAYEIIGHTWSLPTADLDTDSARWVSQFHSRFKPQTERKIVVGRIQGQ
ncbi:hypothetical protein N8642_00725 [bacterium]|jgi:hypothetical protein|nr:hypothetical protein [bacterium]